MTTSHIPHLDGPSVRLRNMWQRGLNWAAIILVGVFGVLWAGVVIYADHGSTFWMRVVQVVFGGALLGWAVQRAVWMVMQGVSDR